MSFLSLRSCSYDSGFLPTPSLVPSTRPNRPTRLRQRRRTRPGSLSISHCMYCTTAKSSKAHVQGCHHNLLLHRDLALFLPAPLLAGRELLANTLPGHGQSIQNIKPVRLEKAKKAPVTEAIQLSAIRECSCSSQKVRKASCIALHRIASQAATSDCVGDGTCEVLGNGEVRCGFHSIDIVSPLPATPHPAPRVTVTKLQALQALCLLYLRSSTRNNLSGFWIATGQTSLTLVTKTGSSTSS